MVEFLSLLTSGLDDHPALRALVVNVLLGRETAQGAEANAADQNDDGDLTVEDLVLLTPAE